MNKIIINLLIISILCSVVTGCNEVASKKIDTADAFNTLVWNLSSYDLTSWDPHYNNSSMSSDIIRQLYEGLTISGENGYELGTAESFILSPNKDGVKDTVYTFKLRHDAKWSDGQNVTAMDFEYSFKRACDPEKGDKPNEMYRLYIKGADEYAGGKGSKDNMMVKALDKHTLEIELKNPTPYFMDVLAMTQFVPVRKDIVEKVGEGWETDPKTCISNGPYKLLSYEKGSSINMTKNEHYYCSDKINISNIKCLIQNKSESIYTMYKNNEIHITRINPVGNIKKEDLFKTKYLSSSYIVFNTSKKPFDNECVRKSFAYIIDRKYLCEQIYYGAVVAAGLIPPDIILSEERMIKDERIDKTDLFKIQPERSKELIYESGYDSNFPEIELTVSWEALGNVLKSMFENNINVNIKLDIVSYEELMVKQKTGDYDMIVTSWTADYNDPMTFLGNFSSSSNQGSKIWSSKEYDEYINKSMTAVGGERDKYLIDAESILLNEQIIAPLYFTNSCYLINNNFVDNIKFDAMGNLIIKNGKLNIDNIKEKKSNANFNSKNNIEILYKIDDRNRIDEIDKNGFFNDSAGYLFDKYITSEHFEIYYNSGNDTNKIYASSALKILEENYSRILNFLSVEEKNMPVVKINLYDEYEPLRQSLIEEINFDSDKMGGIYGITVYSNSIYILYKSKGKTIDFSTTLQHEFTHNVTMALANEKQQDDWLWEGTAKYLSQKEDYAEPYYEEMLKAGLPQIYSLKRNDRDRYIYGYSMVEYIVEQYGQEKLIELLKEYSDLEKVMNVTENEFRDGWTKFMKKKVENN